MSTLPKIVICSLRLGAQVSKFETSRRSKVAPLFLSSLFNEEDFGKNRGKNKFFLLSQALTED